jgi:hypothetical protein
VKYILAAELSMLLAHARYLQAHNEPASMHIYEGRPLTVC